MARPIPAAATVAPGKRVREPDQHPAGDDDDDEGGAAADQERDQACDPVQRGDGLAGGGGVGLERSRAFVGCAAAAGATGVALAAAGASPAAVQAGVGAALLVCGAAMRAAR